MNTHSEHSIFQPVPAAAPTLQRGLPSTLLELLEAKRSIILAIALSKPNRLGTTVAIKRRGFVLRQFRLWLMQSIVQGQRFNCFLPKRYCTLLENLAYSKSLQNHAKGCEVLRKVFRCYMMAFSKGKR